MTTKQKEALKIAGAILASVFIVAAALALFGVPIGTPMLTAMVFVAPAAIGIAVLFVKAPPGVPEAVAVPAAGAGVVTVAQAVRSGLHIQASRYEWTSILLLVIIAFVSLCASAAVVLTVFYGDQENKSQWVKSTALAGMLQVATILLYRSFSRWRAECARLHATIWFWDCVCALDEKRAAAPTSDDVALQVLKECALTISRAVDAPPSKATQK